MKYLFNSFTFLCLLMAFSFGCRSKTGQRTAPGKAQTPVQIACEAAAKKDDPGKPEFKSGACSCTADKFSWDAKSEKCEEKTTIAETNENDKKIQEALESAKSDYEEDSCKDSSKHIWSADEEQCYKASKMDDADVCGKVSDFTFDDEEEECIEDTAVAGTQSFGNQNTFSGINSVQCEDLARTAAPVQWNQELSRCICTDGADREPHPDTFECTDIAEIDADLNSIADVNGDGKCEDSTMSYDPYTKRCLTSDEVQEMAKTCPDTFDAATNSCGPKENQNGSLLKTAVKCLVGSCSLTDILFGN